MNQTDTRDYTAQYSLLPFFYWGAFASIASYASFYLLSIGYRNSVIGMIIAIAGIFSAIFQPIIAGYADRPDSISLKKIVLLITGVQIAGYIVLFLGHNRMFTLSGVIYAMEIGLHQLSTPLINSLGTELLNQDKKLNYGVGRSMGSVGYAIVAFVLGIVTSRFDSSSVLFLALLLLGFLEFFLFLFPFQKTRKTRSAVSEQGAGGFAFFARYRRFSVVLVGCVLVYVSHVFINNFTLQVVQIKGGGTAEMGTAQALASILELPVMLLFGWFLKKASCRSWFRITGFFFFLKIFATMVAPNMIVFYVIQVFQMFGWGLITVSSVYYVNSIMEETDKIKGQAYFTMTYTIASVLGSLLGGILLEGFSAGAMLLCGSVMSLLGGLIIFFAA